MTDLFRGVPKRRWRTLATQALVLLASTVFTDDRLLTPRQKNARRRLLRAAGALGKLRR